MIVPAARHYFETLQVFKDAQLGDVFDIDNGLGGSHTVVFRGKTDDGRFIFQGKIGLNIISGLTSLR